MEGGGVDWGPALVALAVGLVLGGIYVWRMRVAAGSAAVPPELPLARRDLEGKRDVLLRQLVELGDTAAKRSPDQLARERYALELETALVLRELDRLAGAEAPPASEPAPAPPAASPTADAEQPHTAGRPALRGFLWGTGSMAALAGLVFLVTQAAGPREPGGSPTGELPVASSAPAADGEEARLRAVLQRDPDDLDARLALAEAYLQRQEMMGVWNETQYVLERSPGQPRALAYQSLVRLAMGQPEIALEMLEQAIATAPDHIDAYVPLSLVQMRLGRSEDAARTLAEAKRRFPEQAEGLAALESQLRASLGEGPVGLEGDPHAGIAPPREATGSAATPAGAPAAQSGGTVSGTVALDPALQGQVSSGVLFLILREAGLEGGPPVAVRRLVPRSLPLRFEIGEADSMTGDALPDEVRVEARLDSDGDPITRPETDPWASLDGVALGSRDLELVLRRAE
jgi:tetratricopeptide (TPR) repeat protein